MKVEDEDEPRVRTALPDGVEGDFAEDVRRASSRPRRIRRLYEYVRKREFGEEGTTEPAPAKPSGSGTRS